MPLCSADNVRLVLINRRLYAGSSAYSPAELKDLVHGRKVFMERLGAQVGKFLLWFVEDQALPSVSVDGKTGGLVLMGWSMGCTLVLAFLGHPEAIQNSTYTELETYLRKVVLFGAYRVTRAAHVLEDMIHRSASEGVRS